MAEIDPYIISNYQALGGQEARADAQTLAGLLTARNQNQAARWQLGRQQTLADIVSRNAGAFQDPYAQALAHGGFGQEAFEAQQRSFERGQQILGLHRQLTASRLSAAQTPQQLDAVLQSMPPDVQQLYGAPAKDATPEEKDAWKKSFLAGQLTPEQQAENTIKLKGLEKDRYDVKDVDGVPYKIDKTTGIAYPLSAGPAGSEVAAPVGSKRFTQKAELLGKLKDDLDPTSGKSDLAMAAQSKIAAAERFEALVNAPGPRTMQRMYEAATLAAQIASGGNAPTQSSIEEMLPTTMRGRSAAWWQSVKGEPVDAGLDPFWAQMEAQSEREKAVAQKQIRDYQLSRLALHPQAFQSFPEEANQMAEAAGLKGLYDPKTGRTNNVSGRVNAAPTSSRGQKENSNAKADGARVTVRYRGKTLTIPKARLSEALKDGAEQVK